MANTKSAIKRIKITAKKTLRNKMIKSRMKTAVKKLNTALENSESAEQLLKVAISEIDKAVSKGIIHRNQGQRKKSRLMKKFNEKTA